MVYHGGVGEDGTPPVRRTTVAEAAEVLGISAEAVRGRIRRATLPVEREGGTVYVLLEEGEQSRTTDDKSRTTGDQPGDRTDLLIAELQDRVRSLEEANRENRRIIAALTSRIPAIEAPPEARESPETSSDAGTNTRYPRRRRRPQRRVHGGGGGSVSDTEGREHRQDFRDRSFEVQKHISTLSTAASLLILAVYRERPFEGKLLAITLVLLAISALLSIHGMTALALDERRPH